MATKRIPLKLHAKRGKAPSLFTPELVRRCGELYRSGTPKNEIAAVATKMCGQPIVETQIIDAAKRHGWYRDERRVGRMTERQIEDAFLRSLEREHDRRVGSRLQ